MENTFRMMKKLVYIFILLGCWSCEDVIDVETPTGDQRLIVDGLIRVDTDEPYIPVEIKVSMTAGFFNETTPTSVESMLIIYERMEDGTVSSTGVSNLAEKEPGTGIYVPDLVAICDMPDHLAVLVDHALGRPGRSRRLDHDLGRPSVACHRR